MCIVSKALGYGELPGVIIVENPGENCQVETIRLPNASKIRPRGAFWEAVFTVTVFSQRLMRM
jgi:hypothetical protein